MFKKSWNVNTLYAFEIKLEKELENKQKKVFFIQNKKTNGKTFFLRKYFNLIENFMCTFLTLTLQY